MTNLRYIVASNMRANRKQRGLTQEELAALVDTASNYISLIESAKKFPSVDMLERISTALGVDTLAFFTTQPLNTEYEKHVLMVQKNLTMGINRVVRENLRELERLWRGNEELEFMGGQGAGSRVQGAGI
jgi:transcriptional regulator with XRE-family HTH domain